MSEFIEDEKIYSKHKCSSCKKTIYVDPQYRYKKWANNRRRYFCSMECMNKFTSFQGDQNESSKISILDKDISKIKEMYFERGWSIEDISNALGYTYNTISSFCLKCIDDYPGGK